MVVLSYVSCAELLFPHCTQETASCKIRFCLEQQTMKLITSPERLVTNIKSAKFKAFADSSGKEVPGQSYLQWDDTFPEGAGFTIYRMAPGSSSQPHEHTCHEQFYVIEGELSDNDGFVYRQGDFVLLKKGTQHFSTTQTGATLAVFVRELEENL
jgi:quercetin dioxygenase-like cupin family protein